MIPDGTDETTLQLFLAPEHAADSTSSQSPPDATPPFTPRPTFLNMSMISQSMREQFDATAAQGELGLPAALFETLHELISEGLDNGFMPLTTWYDALLACETTGHC